MITYCIFDSDFHTEEEKSKRLNDARDHEINLHIWNKKEIENYLFIPSAICRTVKSKKKQSEISENEVACTIDLLCEELKDDVIDWFATEIRNRDTSKDLRTVNQLARKYINPKWDSEKWNLVPGKAVLSKLFLWISENYKVSLNKFLLAREISLAEVDPEMIKVITCIENKTDF